ncbi:MAG TPA: BREX-1 system adenine-specific DNA-methyltransferase PglX, partial [Actinomycetota bacterium]|nr:BREX-1 system adenine-specific DNA-methyltransferase PglX [Actinomycetota bacterium]
MRGLDATGRSQLERAVTRARAILERDLAVRAEGRYGIHTAGRIDDESSLRLSPAELAARRELVEVIEHLRPQTAGAKQAVERLIREAAFTHLNRLLAIRVAEAIGLLPETLARGRQSEGFRLILEVAPLLGDDDTGGYSTFLRLCADELAPDAPALFDPRNPLLALEPSPAALDELVDILASGDLAEVWPAADTLGWAYQFFNTGAERREMREGGAPRSSRELAVRNQFFTPRYVVDFLVQNSLGRRLGEAGHADLLDDLPLLLDPPEAGTVPLELEDVAILDPAVGSGHFLLGCYDLLERAWARQGVEAADAAPRIVGCLHGIDIDPRCAQVAAAAIVLRARRACGHADLPRVNILTARPLPADDNAWAAALDGLSPEHRALVASLRDALADAAELGSLLKVEERLSEEMRRILPEGTGEGTLFEGIEADAFGRAEAEVLAAAQRVADQASSSAAERLLAAEASDAIRFVEAMRRRYDVVLMNPPFGEPIPGTKDYIKAAYAWIPTKDANVLAAFVGRGVELCRDGGYVGAITSRAGLFLTTFEKWRRNILLGHRMAVLADLGYGVMEQAMVEAAAYVVGADRSDGSPLACVRLLRETDRPGALAEAITAERRGESSPLVYRVTPTELEAVPGSPISYWMAPSIRRLFTDLPPLEGNGGEARQGLATGDDFRFVRAFWEVDPRKIARTREETFEGKKWVPFAKGGEYSPFWADIHLVVNWENDGKEIRAYPGSRPQNTQYYFRPGVTWSYRTQARFNPRLVPPGCAFSHTGNMVFPPAGDEVAMLGWLSTRILEAALIAVATFGKYEVGSLQKMPTPFQHVDPGVTSSVQESMTKAIQPRLDRDRLDETTHAFVAPLVMSDHNVASIRSAVLSHLERSDASVCAALDVLHDVEEIFMGALHLDRAARTYLDEEVGVLTAQLPCEELDEVATERASKAYGGGGETGAGTYQFAPELEAASRAAGRHPRAVARWRREASIVPVGVEEQAADDVVSYLLGCAFGRWDVRAAKTAQEDLDPSAPQPRFAPGLLIENDAPASVSRPGYPIRWPADRLLVDDAAHPADVVAATRDAAGAVLSQPDGILDEVERILGRDLRAHFRRAFFKDHLRRYTKSRRKAPIYWHLSVPSREWGVWVYVHAFNRESLYAIAGHASRREGVGRDRLAALLAERERGDGRSRRDLDRQISDEEQLLEELSVFRTEADRIAGLG